jgi:hypothetical protein
LIAYAMSSGAITVAGAIFIGKCYFFPKPPRPKRLVITHILT